jgi:RNA polymerase-binding transcription factor DksA
MTNLPDNLKTDWVETDIVLPEHVNGWNGNINDIKDLLPIYSSTGNFYVVQKVGVTESINRVSVILKPCQPILNDYNEINTYKSQGTKLYFFLPSTQTDIDGSLNVSIVVHSEKYVSVMTGDLFWQDNKHITYNELTQIAFLECVFDSSNKFYATNDVRINDLQRLTSTHTTQISDLTTTVSEHTETLEEHADEIATNMADIATNTQNIKTNADNIATNKSAIKKYDHYFDGLANGESVIKTASGLSSTNVAFKKYNTGEVFSSSDVVVVPQDNTVDIYKSLVDDNVGNDITDTTKYAKIDIDATLKQDASTAVKRATETTSYGDTTNPVYIASTGYPVASKYTIEPARFDGQWVSSVKELSTATAVGTYTIDLSSYLPDDNYNYEVKISNFMFGENNTSRAFLGTTLFQYNVDTYSGTMGACSPNSKLNSNIFDIPVASTSRKLTFQIYQKAFSSTTLYALGYRRIGTNT